MAYPKLVALDTDWTIFWGWLKINELGKGHGAYALAQDNLEPENGSEWILRDRTNHQIRIGMYQDVPKIIHDILKNGAKLAIVSRNTSRAACDKALWWFKATDPRDNKKKPIIEMVTFDEVYDTEKTHHLSRIQGWTGFSYADMILYDDEATNNLVRVKEAVTFQVSRDQKGLTWENYQQGLNLWRRVHAIRSPYLGQNLKSYSDPIFLGFAGMDEQTVKLLTQGKNRVDLKESARWGYAMYVTDDIRVAKYFSGSIKVDAFGLNAKTYVCEIWARDRAKFLATSKVWFPEDRKYMSDIKKDGAFKISWDQENRDMQAAQWGASAPYILFSRHIFMNGMRMPEARWNEMVIYSQIQEALILTIPLTHHQVEQKIQLGSRFQPYEQRISQWNIKVPNETWEDFKAYKERIHS